MLGPVNIQSSHSAHMRRYEKIVAKDVEKRNDILTGSNLGYVVCLCCGPESWNMWVTLKRGAFSAWKPCSNQRVDTGEWSTMNLRGKMTTTKTMTLINKQLKWEYFEYRLHLKRIYLWVLRTPQTKGPQKQTRQVSLHIFNIVDVLSLSLSQ